jgi:gas vesicle protein
MKHTNTGLSLLGGAVLGAAAMYILDPEAGNRRRHALGDKAGDALRGTGDRLGDAWSQTHRIGAELISHAHDIGGHLADRARAEAHDHLAGISDQATDARDQAAHRLKGLQGRLADLGHDLIGRARQAVGKAREKVDQAQQSARESTHPLRHKIAHTIDPDHDGHAAGHATAYAGAGVGAVALGAAAMYFLDPAKGRQRRDFVAGQITRCVQETGHFCQLTGQYVMRLWHGQAGSAESGLEPADPLAGEQLVQRVRAEISHLLSNPAQVQLMADAEGIVTLYGKVPAGELDSLLKAVSAVPGVRAVVDHIDVPAPATPEGQPSTAQPAPRL